MFHFFRKPPESKKPSVPETEADGFVLLVTSRLKKIEKCPIFRGNLESRLLCCPGWSAVAPSRLTAASTYWAQTIVLPQPPSSWDHRPTPPCVANFRIFCRHEVFPCWPDLPEKLLPHSYSELRLRTKDISEAQDKLIKSRRF
ncbi:UBAP1-MVB12-associated (UMA)-domain containing protein 1 isoform X9 [Macaca fascicularis]|uniref:UBAP1-MVB12-associated (UMA)-domain containing protein 1 isoform X9 n=1 Tax=Macaca fascicularis TaxID=9541 RepID=UPI003D158734